MWRVYRDDQGGPAFPTRSEAIDCALDSQAEFPEFQYSIKEQPIDGTKKTTRKASRKTIAEGDE